MQALQNCDLLSRNTHIMDQLQDFLCQRRETRQSVKNLGAFAELPRRFVATAREALGQERRLCIFVSIAIGCLLEYPLWG